MTCIFPFGIDGRQRDGLHPVSPSPAQISCGSRFFQPGAFEMKNPARNNEHARASRRWFSNMLWRAFPSASERELSHKAARALDVSPRQVVNWLREEHDASLRYVTAVLAIAGAEVVFKHIEGKK